jgi:excisionase family DNA binding protein
MPAQPLSPTDEMIRRLTPVTAPPEQRAKLQALSRALEGIAAPPPSCELVGPAGERIALPKTVFKVLAQVVEVMARGDAITVVAVDRELTTQQAADLLNVSRQYLVRLLDGEVIPFRRTGKHRRLLIEDVLAYRDQRDRERRAGLQELSQMSQDLGGYDAEHP